MVANSVYMKISGCPGRVSVAQRSEHRYVGSETLVSIPSWGSEIFCIYKYDRIKSSYTYMNICLLKNLDWVDSIYGQRYTRGWKMCQVVRLYQIVKQQQRESRNFQIFAFSQWLNLFYLLLRILHIFLQKLKSIGHVPETVIMCTIDVVGLYPHIPHGEGLDSLRKVFEYADCVIPEDDIIKFAKLVLENNYFEFNGKIFRQKLGTAIGTKFAPAHANIFMDYLEQEMIEKCEFKPWIW